MNTMATARQVLPARSPVLKKARVLVLDYTACGTREPNAASMYACLRQKYDMKIIALPCAPHVRLLAALRSFHPQNSKWSRRYWQILEGYQHSPKGYRQTTDAYARATAGSHAEVVLQFGALFGPIPTRGARGYLTYHDGNMAITSRSPSHQAQYMNAEQLAEWLQLERSLVRGASRVLTYSRRTRDSYIHDYGCDETQVVAVGSSNWVKLADREWVDGLLGQDLDTLNRRRDGRKILFVYTDFERKGGPALLQAFENLLVDLPHAQLIAVGPHPELARGRNVESRGMIRDRAELFKLYREASVFVLPSLNDPFPRVIFEAMAHGLPCIGTRVGGIPEQIINGKTGIVIEPGVVEPLTAALRRLLENEDERRALGCAGREHLAANFMPESVAARVAEQIEQVC